MNPIHGCHLITPDDLESGTVHVELPKGWKASLPWRPLAGQTGVYAVSSYDELVSNGLLLGTHAERVFQEGAFRVTLAVGGAMKPSMPMLEKVMKPHIAAYTRMFGAVPRADYLVTLHEGLTDGGAFANSYSLLASEPLTEANLIDWGHIVSHETFHLWNGTGMEPSADIYARLLKNRIVFLGSEVNDQVANFITAQMLYLEAEDPEKDIWLYINSPGGSVTAGMAIYDTMNFIKPDVATICCGIAMSMGSLLLCGGAKGKRTSLPNSRILIHQPSSPGFEGQATDIEIHAREIIKTRRNLERIYAKHTGQTEEQVHLDLERDRFFTPEQAMEYGLIDSILEPH